MKEIETLYGAVIFNLLDIYDKDIVIDLIKITSYMQND